MLRVTGACTAGARCVGSLRAKSGRAVVAELAAHAARTRILRKRGGMCNGKGLVYGLISRVKLRCGAEGKKAAGKDIGKAVGGGGLEETGVRTCGTRFERRSVYPIGFRQHPCPCICMPPDDAGRYNMIQFSSSIQATVVQVRLISCGGPECLVHTVLDSFMDPP